MNRAQTGHLYGDFQCAEERSALSMVDYLLHRLRLVCASPPAPLSERQYLTNDPTDEVFFWTHWCFNNVIENALYESGYASGKFDVIGWE